MRRAVLINERDVRLGTLDVGPATLVVRHGGSTFVRTGETIRLKPAHRALVDVFVETEVYVRNNLEPIP